MANRNVVDILIRARDEASRVLDEAKREIEQLERTSTTAGTNASRALKQIEDRATSLGSTLTRFGTVWSAAVSAPMIALGAVGVRSQMQLQTFQASLNVLVGDAEKAQDVFDELYEFDTKTTFSWPSLSNATRLLAAFNVEAEDIIPTLSRLGDLSAGVNIGIDEMAEIFGKAKVQGRLFMEDVNQLTGRGIPVIQEFAKQFGVTEDQVRSLVSTGQIHFQHLEQAIVSLTSEGGRFHNLMQAQGETTAGRLLQLRKEFEQLTDQIGAALIPTIDTLIDRARSAVAWFVDLDEGTQKIIITVGIAAAAVGPLAVGLGQVANGVGAVVRALPAMRVAFLAMATPPTGWILLAVTGIIALVAALASRGRDSLTSAVEEARASLAGGDAASLVSGLDRVISKVDGPVRTSLQELQEELRTTGDVGVEMAERIEAALHQAVVQQAQAQVAAASAELEALRDIQLNSRRATPDEVIGPLRDRLAAFGRADLATGLSYDQANNRFALPEGTRLGLGQFDMQIVDAIAAANRQVAEVTTDHAQAIGAATDRLTAAWANLERVTNPTQPAPPTTTTTNSQRPPAGSPLEAVAAAAESAWDAYLETVLNPSRIAAMVEAEAAGPGSGMDSPLSAGAIRYRLRRAASAAWDAYMAVVADPERVAAMVEAEVAGPGAGMDSPLSPGAIRYRLRLAASAAWDAYLAVVADPERVAAMVEAEVAGPGAGMDSPLSPGAIAARLRAVKDRQDAEAQAVVDAYLAIVNETTRLAAMAEAEVAGPGAGMNSPLSAEAISYRLRVARERADAEANVVFDAYLEQMRETGRIAQMVEAEVLGPGAGMASPFSPAALRYRLRQVAPRPITAPGVRAEVNEDRFGGLPDEQRKHILDAEIEARRELIESLTTMSADQGPLRMLGASLLNLAIDTIPFLGSAIEGFIQAGPMGALTAVFTDMLASSTQFQKFIEALMDAVAPLVDLIGTILSPLFKVLAGAVRIVVDGFIAVYNFLLGWLFGRIQREEDPDPPPAHSSRPPTLREVDFSTTGQGVQLAVATPLLEAARTQMTAASTLLTAAASINSTFTRVEAFYTRLLEQGITVTPAPASGGAAGGLSRAAIVRA